MYHSHLFEGEGEQFLDKHPVTREWELEERGTRGEREGTLPLWSQLVI